MKSINAFVKARENEDVGDMIKRFNDKVYKSGILQTLKDKEFYLKPSAKKRLKKLKRAKGIV